MAKDLHSLIRLARSRVDERQRALAGLLRQVEDLETHKVELEHRLAQERAVARSAPETAGAAYGAFVREVVARRDRLIADIEAREREIDSAREVLSAAYRELQTLETAQEQRDRLRAAEDARQEQASLDEIGRNGHTRRRS